MSRRKNSSEASQNHQPQLLRISEVARRVKISSSALRAWETLGLVTPQRTKSRYRLYTEADVRLLQRALFLRRARGLNPPAIVHVLKRQGAVALPAEAATLPGQRFRRLRARRGLSLAQVARATGVSVGFAHRKVLETKDGVRMELLAWGNTVMEPHLFRVKSGGGSGESYVHEGEEFLHVLRGGFEVWLGDDEHYVLKAGDSLYFESSTPHRWRNPGRSEAWLLWVNTPPTF